jgi:hypothetical protein
MLDFIVVHKRDLDEDTSFKIASYESQELLQEDKKDKIQSNLQFEKQDIAKTDSYEFIDMNEYIERDVRELSEVKEERDVESTAEDDKVEADAINADVDEDHSALFSDQRKLEIEDCNKVVSEDDEEEKSCSDGEDGNEITNNIERSIDEYAEETNELQMKIFSPSQPDNIEEIVHQVKSIVQQYKLKMEKQRASLNRCQTKKLPLRKRKNITGEVVGVIVNQIEDKFDAGIRSLPMPKIVK